MGEVVHCEVCHEEYNVKEMRELSEKYAEEIYRPGEDISKMTNLSEDEKSERRREIAEIFAISHATGQTQFGAENLEPDNEDEEGVTE